jgi:hypothetical protein
MPICPLFPEEKEETRIGSLIGARIDSQRGSQIGEDPEMEKAFLISSPVEAGVVVEVVTEIGSQVVAAVLVNQTASMTVGVDQEVDLGNGEE